MFGFGPEFAWLGNGTILSIPVPVWIFVLIFVIGAHVWYQTPWGRHMVAIGGAREAAKALGIKTQAIPFWLYVASGAAASVGGLIITSQLDGASVSIGIGMELDVLTASCSAASPFTGGRGSLLGVLFGVLFIGALTTASFRSTSTPIFRRWRSASRWSPPPDSTSFISDWTGCACRRSHGMRCPAARAPASDDAERVPS